MHKSNLEYIGTVSKTKGFRGDMLLKDVQKGVTTLAKSCKLYIGYSPSFVEPAELARFVRKNRSTIIAFKGILSESQAAKYLELAVFTERHNINPDKNKEVHLTEDIIGTDTFDAVTNSYIGTIVEIIYAPANDVWVIETNEKDILFPAVKNFIKKHNLDEKKVWINLPDGIKEL